MAERKRNDEIILMTQEGYDKLNNELKQLRSDERYKIAHRIEEARSFGDLSENAEYAAAKDDQAKLEGKIQVMEYQLSHAKVIDSATLDGSHVAVGTQVKVTDITHGRDFVYSIVGSEESDPQQGRISSSSPVGRALINHRKNEEILVKIPMGIRKLKIVEIKVL